MQDGPGSFVPDEMEWIRPVPQRRISEKVDELMAHRDYAGVERTLLYWLAEAGAGGDRRGELTVRTELVGHYRKTGEAAKALEQADAALRLLRETGYEGTLTAATTRVNIATALNAFRDNERALALFGEARAVMEHSAACSPSLLSGLYNNMGLALTALSRPKEALDLFALAMEQNARIAGSELEQAVTCLNMADAVEARDGLEKGDGEINELLAKGEAYLTSPSVPRDGYCAYVYERCAPTYEYYGWFALSAALRREAEAIYERT